MNPHAEAIRAKLDTVLPENLEHVKLLIAALEKFDGKITFVKGIGK